MSIKPTRIVRRVAPLLVALLAASALLATEAAASTPAERSYVALIKKPYVPLRAAWVRATVPCQREEWARCAARSRAVDAHARKLLSVLRKSKPPPSLAEGDRMLERGVKDLIKFHTGYIPAVANKDPDAVAKLECRCTVGADIVNAIGEINYVVPSARLPDFG